MSLRRHVCYWSLADIFPATFGVIGSPAFGAILVLGLVLLAIFLTQLTLP
jgi:hypothetical protein